MKIQKNVDKIYRNKCNEWRSERKRKQKAGIILIAVFLLLWGTLSHKLASVATSIAFAERGFRYTCGIFKKATRFVRYGDVQQTEFRANRVQQRLGNAKLSFIILSAAAERRTATGYFPESALEALAAHIVKARDTSTKLWE